MFHFYNEATGGPVGAIVLTGLTETTILYGSETINAQMASNIANKGVKGATQLPVHRSPFKMWGPGVGLNVTRNVVAMSGLRVLCDPITRGLQKVTGSESTTTVLVGDFLANCCAAVLSAPLHQLYVLRFLLA